MSQAAPIRLLIADDSAGVRSALRVLFRNQPDIEIIATARNGREAVHFCQRFDPDIVLMDLEMPELSGAEAVREIMRTHPVPVLVFSSLARDAGPRSLEALDAGALDVVNKGSAGESALDIGAMRDQLLTKIRQYARRGGKRDPQARSSHFDTSSRAGDARSSALETRAAAPRTPRPAPHGDARPSAARESQRESKPDAERRPPAPATPPEHRRDAQSSRSPSDSSRFSGRETRRRGSTDTAVRRGLGIKDDTRQRALDELVARGPGSDERARMGADIKRRGLPKHRPKLVVVGGSTGAPQAVQALIKRLPRAFPLPVVIAQHMPASFTESFARRLRVRDDLSVRVVSEHQRLQPRQLYLAPGGTHTQISARAGALYVDPVKEDFIGMLHKPSVELLFRSALQACRGEVIAVVLSGMGRDGAQAAHDLHRAGASVLVQDESTSAVFGMPRSVIDLGAADLVLPVHHLGDALAMLTNTMPLT